MIITVLQNAYDGTWFENMAGMAIRPNFKRKKIGNHYNSVVRARMGYNTSLMLTNFFTIFVPQHGHFHGRFVTLKWVLFVRPWYIRRRIEKNNFCELVVVWQRRCRGTFWRWWWGRCHASWICVGRFFLDVDVLV